mgnify:FL=1
MKRKEIVAGVLAGTLLLTSSIEPGLIVTKAEAVRLNEGLVGSYTFDEETIGTASAIVTGGKEYKQNLEFAEGKKGKALQLGDYGLELNKKNLGDNFTVSLWLKPDGVIKDNQSVLFLGYHNPEKWISVAGKGNGNSICKLWANGNGYSWSEIGNLEISSEKWHCLTITGNESEVTAWLDGAKVGSGESNASLVGENQDIYIGVTNWDEEFTGLVDEIKVYNRTLSEGEIYQLYDDTAAEEILEQKGIQVTENLKLIAGRSEKIKVNMPAVVEEANPKVTYQSSNKDIADVDENGTVKAIKEGETVITTSVTLGKAKKEASTLIVVEDSIESTLVGAFDFEGNLKNNVENQRDASAMITGLKDYTKEVNYEKGKEGKAVHLGNYGLKLNMEDIGTEYTVSMWVKSDKGLTQNQCLLFLGYHNPERWLALSGNRPGITSAQCKLWAKGENYGTHTTLLLPTISPNDWHQLTISGTEEKVTMYLDGVCLGQQDSNNPLEGENQDIYLGVNNWDAEYGGLVDTVRIYNIALSEEEVQGQAKEEYNNMLQEKLEKALEEKDILGENESLDAITTDLVFPEKVGDMKLAWSSSKEDIIALDGTFHLPVKDTNVTITASIQEGTLSAKKQFQVTGKALDMSERNTLVEEAKKLDQTYLTEESKKNLNAAFAEATSADTFEKVKMACAKLKMAIEELEYIESYMNPFTYIEQKTGQKSVKVGESITVFKIPEEIEDMVSITYQSGNEKVAVYENGKVNAVASGETVVTTIVEAKYDGFQMEYATVIDVEDTREEGDEDIVKPDAEQNGNSSLDSKQNENKVVKTGDEQNPLLSISIFALASVVITGSFIRRKKYNL